MSVTTYAGTVRNGKVESSIPLDLVEGSEVYIVVPTTMTKRVAKRKANGWLIGYVGNLLMADQGVLVQTGKEWMWRFAVYSTSLTHQPMGPIGFIEINTATGSIVNAEQTKLSLYRYAQTH